ncbi:MAG: porin family protein [Chitinophagaceae bacterium]
MKKLFLVTGAFVLMTIAATAQTAQFGVKAGVNVSSIKVSTGSDFDSKAGLYAGGLAHIHLSRNFAIQPEVVYSMQGGKNGNVTRRQNYINIPVLAQYMTNTGFRLETGPQIGFVVAAKNKVGDVETDVKDGMKTAEFGWTVGAGYLFPKTGFGIDARYNFGITSILEAETPEARNMVLQVGVFYHLPGHTHLNK